MTLAGRDEVWIDGELIAFDADGAVNDRLTAWVIGEAKGDFGLVAISFLSQFQIKIPNYKFKNVPGAKFGI